MFRICILLLLIPQIQPLFPCCSDEKDKDIDWLSIWSTERTNRKPSPLSATEASAAESAAAAPKTPPSGRDSPLAHDKSPGAARAAVFSGGGVRGAFSAKCYELFVKQVFPSPAEHSDVFDLFCGTSTGSLIALASAMPYHPELVTVEDKGRDTKLHVGAIKLNDAMKPTFVDGPYTPENIVALYKLLSSEIFVPRSCRQTWCGDEDDGGCCGAISLTIKSAWDCTFGCRGWSGFNVPGCRSFGSCFSLCGPKYSNKKLKYLLTKYFGDITFNELKHPVIVVATNIDKREGEYLSPRNTPDMLVADAALASTAAQTYFPPVQVVKDPSVPAQKTAYCDGGISDNSPCMAAIVEILAVNKGKLPDDFFLMHFGTGTKPKEERFPVFENRGAFLWLFELIKQGIEASASGGFSLAKSLNTGITSWTDDRVFEIQTILEGDPALDDVSSIDAWIALADNTQREVTAPAAILRALMPPTEEETDNFLRQLASAVATTAAAATGGEAEEKNSA